MSAGRVGNRVARQATRPAGHVGAMEFPILVSVHAWEREMRVTPPDTSGSAKSVSLPCHHYGATFERFFSTTAGSY